MFNRYLSKTLLRAYGANKLSANALTLMMTSSQPKSLVQFNRMGFFDYDNKDKNIFTSDEEEGDAKPKQRGSRQAQNNFGEDDFFSQPYSTGFEQHKGKYEVEEIPLYITKMRKEVSELKKIGFRNKTDEHKSYFPKINGVISMHFQNREQIKAEYPRFSTVFYEFLAYNQVKGSNNTYDFLEDHILEANMPNMPIPGIKNFIQAMNAGKRGRRSTIKKVKDHLIERKAFNDVKSNITILSALNNLRGLDSDFYHQSMQAIQNEINVEIEQNAANLEERIVVQNGFIRQIFEITTRFLADSDIEFTAEEIKEFLSRHKEAQHGSVKFVQANETTKTIKDHILLTIYQYSLLYIGQKSSYRQLLSLLAYKSDSKKNGVIAKEIPHLQEKVIAGIEDFKSSIKESDFKPRLNMNQSKISNALTELGVYFVPNERVGDVFKVNFFLPKQNTVLEYIQPPHHVKTEDVAKDKLFTGTYHYRKYLLENFGYKVITFDYFDIIETDGNHPKVVNKVRERLGLSEAKKE